MMSKLTYRTLILGYGPSRTRLIKPTISRHKSDGRAGEEHGEEHIKERAPSTAEILRQMLEEKERLRKMLEEKERQGVVSQTSEKAFDALMEAIGDDPDPEKIKKIYMQAAPGETYRRIPDQKDEDDSVRTHL